MAPGTGQPRQAGLDKSDMTEKSGGTEHRTADAREPIEKRILKRSEFFPRNVIVKACCRDGALNK
jgi:hypothetical protein